MAKKINTMRECLIELGKIDHKYRRNQKQKRINKDLIMSQYIAKFFKNVKDKTNGKKTT